MTRFCRQASQGLQVKIIDSSGKVLQETKDWVTRLAMTRSEWDRAHDGQLQNKDTISVTSNMLRDCNTDFFPILQAQRQC
eukprot:s415_g15.t1